MTIEEFGQTIKQKYPSYADMSDAELGQKMLTKFPQYQDMIDSPSIARQTQQGGIIGRLKSFDQNVLSDINLGSKIGSGIFKGLIGNTAKTVVQMPQSFATGALGLADAAGIEGAGELRERVAKPINAPILGEVKPLSAVPTDLEAATPKEALGQAIGMLPEAATFGVFSMPGSQAIPKTALGKLAQSFGVGTEFGVLSGGSAAMRRNASDEEVLGEAIKTGLMSGGISLGLTAASMIPSGELARVPADIKGIIVRAKNAAVEKIKSIMPYTTNMKKADIKLATNPDIAPKIQERLEVLREGNQTGRVQEAEDYLKQLNYEKYKAVYGAAKDKAGKNYEAGRAAIEKNFGGVQADGESLRKGAVEAVKKYQGRVTKDGIHIAGDEKGSDIISDMYARLQESGEKPTVKELFELKSYLSESFNELEQGTRSFAAGSAILGQVDDQIDALTKGASTEMNTAYRAFKQAQTNVAPLWRNDAKWDTRLNFVKSLESGAKTGSRQALNQLEEIAGMSGFVNNELQASRLARMLSQEKGITGPRQLDDSIRTGIIGVPAAIGSVFGPLGAGAGAMVGVEAMKRLQSPAWWSNIIYQSFKDKGVKVTADQVQNLVTSPLFQQTIQAYLQSLNQE